MGFAEHSLPAENNNTLKPWILESCRAGDEKFRSIVHYNSNNTKFTVTWTSQNVAEMGKIFFVIE